MVPFYTFLKPRFGTLILLLTFAPILCVAQLPYYPPIKTNDIHAYIGVDFYSFGLPVSVGITTVANNNCIRFGFSPTLPERENPNFNFVDSDELTVYVAYSRLIGNQNGYLEIGGAFIVGNKYESKNNMIGLPAFSFIAGLHLPLSNKVLFRANITPLINSTETKLTAGFGLSYRL